MNQAEVIINNLRQQRAELLNKLDIAVSENAVLKAEKEEAEKKVEPEKKDLCCMCGSDNVNGKIGNMWWCQSCAESLVDMIEMIQGAKADGK